MEVMNNKIDALNLKKRLSDMYTQQIEKREKEVKVVGCTNIGKVRKKNEDNFLIKGLVNKNSETCEFIKNEQIDCNYEWKCFAVFDGMGGGENGEKASLIATQQFSKIMYAINRCKEQTKIDELVRIGFLNANNQIRKVQEDGMICGTTGTVLVTNGKKFKVFHIGDSRAYLFRRNKLFQITRDQTLAQMKVDIGIYESLNEAPERENHQLTEYIGRDYTGMSIKPVESEWVDLSYGDKILICTDGLYDMCSDSEMGKIICESDKIENAVGRLVDAALEHGGVDNITCILLESKHI